MTSSPINDDVTELWSFIQNVTEDNRNMTLMNVTIDEISNCGNHSVPTSHWFITHLTTKQLSLLVIYWICAVVTIALFVDETIFILRNFTTNKTRWQKTIWVLAVFPVFSLTGVLGYMIPRSAPVLDLVANTFMASCLYNILELMINYVGGTERLWDIVTEGQLSVHFATLPICCLIPCLPSKKLDKTLLWRLRAMVMQVAIIRPIIMFIAAVMWADGTYYHKGMDLKTGDPYIGTINAITTIIAVFGLNLCKTAFVKPLNSYSLGGKIFIVQMVLATCSLTPGIATLFMRWGLVIECDPIYSPSVHLEAIYRGVLVISMLVYAIIARFLYRRIEDTAELTSYTQEPEVHKDCKTRTLDFIKLPIVFFQYLCDKCCHRDPESNSLRLDYNEIHENGKPATKLDKESPQKIPKSHRTNSKHDSLLSEDINQNGSSVFIDSREGDDTTVLFEIRRGIHNSTMYDSLTDIDITENRSEFV